MAEQMLAQQAPQLTQMLNRTAAAVAPDLLDATVVVRDLVVNRGRPASLRTWATIR